MLTYDDILKKHALGCFSKPAEIPADSLFVGEAERLNEQENIQLIALKQIDPVSTALIDPHLDSVEDIGIVGDGQGIVEQKDFISDGYVLGNPYEEVF